MTPLLSAPLLRSQSDRRLAVLAADGHDRAFEVIVERYRRPLQRYLRRLLSEGLAEDVLQATFVRAWQALRAGTEVRDLRPWLYRIAHNQALNTLRAAGAVLPPVGEALPATSLEAEVERREELRATLHGIEALPDRQRAALVAVAVADRPHADVARELGMSDGALRQLLLRARTALRAAATALTPYPLMSWLAGGQEVTAARVAEVAAGAGSTGVALKASAAMLAAGAVVAGGPAMRDEHAPPQAQAAPRAQEAQRQAAPARAVAAASPAPTPDHEAGDQGDPGGGATGHRGASSGRSGSSDHGSDKTSHGSGSHGPGSGASGSDDSGANDRGDDDSRGPGSGGSGSDDSESSGSVHGDSESGGSGSRDADDGSSGGRSSGKDSSGEGSSGTRESGEDHSGPGAPESEATPAVDDVVTAGPTVTTGTLPSGSGEGSESSGSGSSGSGSSGSGGGGSGDD
jgi:RNA polymerase sigma factor (sigma-70 family)